MVDGRKRGGTRDWHRRPSDTSRREQPMPNETTPRIASVQDALSFSGKERDWIVAPTWAVRGLRGVARPCREYVSWYAAIRRCYNPKDAAYPDYGGRGIDVCARWRGPSGFEAFAVDVGQCPAGLTIDRIDNDGGYWCGKCEDCLSRGVTGMNCRWATRKEQSANQRKRRPRDKIPGNSPPSRPAITPEPGINILTSALRKADAYPYALPASANHGGIPMPKYGRFVSFAIWLQVLRTWDKSILLPQANLAVLFDVQPSQIARWIHMAMRDNILVLTKKSKAAGKNPAARYHLADQLEWCVSTKSPERIASQQ